MYECGLQAFGIELTDICAPSLNGQDSALKSRIAGDKVDMVVIFVSEVCRGGVVLVGEG